MSDKMYTMLAIDKSTLHNLQHKLYVCCFFLRSSSTVLCVIYFTFSKYTQPKILHIYYNFIMTEMCI